jgi:NADH-quinone oxidoreductase subunit N
MTTAQIWIFFPALAAIALYAVRERPRLTAAAGTGLALLLALLALLLPIGERIALRLWAGFPTLTISPTMNLLNRRLILDDADRPLLLFVYLGLAFWFTGSRTAKASRLFIPLGLAMASLFAAAIAVEPFLYAALLIVLVAMLSLPLLSPPGQPARRSAQRFLVLQTLGVPFILMAGWLLPSLQAAPLEAGQALRVAAFAVLGFGLYMAVFPFHTWIPMAAEEADPYAAGFVFFLIPGVVSLFGIEFLSRYTWLNSVPQVYEGMRFIGMVMVAMGGIWAAFQRDLGRMLGYAVIVEIGLSLLTFSLGFGSTDASQMTNQAKVGIFYALLLPRGLALGVWALALTALRQRTQSLTFRAVQGAGRSLPLAAAGLLLANFSLAGLPLLAGFPVRLALWTALASDSLPAVFLALVGSAGLLGGGIRSLAVLVMGAEEQGWQRTESRPEAVLLGVGMLILFLVGLLPQWLLPSLTYMAAVIAP